MLNAQAPTMTAENACSSSLDHTERAEAGAGGAGLQRSRTLAFISSRSATIHRPVNASRSARSSMAARPASRRATGTRNGEQET